MNRQTETALLHGHPLTSEEDLEIIELRRQYPAWNVDRNSRGGFSAYHRTETPNERLERVGIRAELHAPGTHHLGEALFVQRALRGDGAEVDQ